MDQINENSPMATTTYGTIRRLTDIIHEYSEQAGWQLEVQQLEAELEKAERRGDDYLAKLWRGAIRSHRGEQLMLMVTEVAEAMEVLRTTRAVDESWYPEGYHEEDSMGNLNGPWVNAGKPEGIPSELADIIIRVLDFCGTYGIDLGPMLIEKINSNIARGYRHGGKTV